jgi:hypothetical protein
LCFVDFCVPSFQRLQQFPTDQPAEVFAILSDGNATYLQAAGQPPQDWVLEYQVDSLDNQGDFNRLTGQQGSPVSIKPARSFVTFWSRASLNLSSART